MPYHDTKMEPLLLLFYILLLSIIIIIIPAILHNKFRLITLLSGENAPPTYPFIGCLISFYKNRHRLLSWYTELLSTSPTQTVVIRRLGARKTIITANPQNVEYMLKTNFVNFPKGKPFTEILNDFLGFGIFNVDGELWHAQRKLASHQFTSRLLKQHVEINVKKAVKSKLFPLLDSFANEGNNMVVDLQEVLRRLGFDIVCKLALGFDPFCLGDNFSLLGEVSILKAFDSAAEISARRAAAPVSAVWKLKKFFGVGSEKVLKDCVKEIHEYVMQVIHERKKKLINININNDININVNNNNNNKSNQNQDLLSKMIMDGMSDELIRDMMISFIMAGRDTTSAAMTWLFYALTRNRHVEETLVNEVGLLFKDNDFDDFKEMKYLQACLFETMRLYPPVSWDSKHAVNDDVLPDGTRVIAGDRVTYFPYGMGRMESIWGLDRFEFRPDRWFEGKTGLLKEVSVYKNPVFQAGPRVCLGKGMANVQMTYVVSSILKRYEVRPVGSGEAVYLPALTARMHGGFKVFVRRRRGDTWQDKKIES